MELKRETLKLKSDVIGKAFYMGTERAPQQVDGKRGTYQRHVLANEKHGIFHVVTPAQTEVFEFESEVEVVGAVFFPDRGINGRDVAPSYNVFAEKIVKGGK